MGRVKAQAEVGQHRIYRRAAQRLAPLVASHERVFTSGLGVGPTPVVIRSDAAGGFRSGQQRNRNVSEQFDVVSVKGFNSALRTPALLTEDGTQGIGRT